MNPKVSIIIPMYNTSKYIYKCLMSIPDREDIEIIAIDDFSTDHTYSIAFKASRLKRKSKVKLLRNPKNMGPGLTRNKGIDVATGEYVMFLDSDDWLVTHLFVHLLDNLPDKDIIFYGYVNNWNKHVYAIRSDGYILLKGAFKIIRRSFLGDIRFPDRLLGEDGEMHCKLMDKNPTYIDSKLMVLHYNYPRSGSITHKYRHNKLQQKDMDEFAKWQKEAFSTYGKYFNKN